MSFLRKLVFNLAKKLAIILPLLFVCGVLVNCNATISSKLSCDLPPKSSKEPIYIKAILHLDPNFSPQEQIAIANSALMWANATGGQTEFKIETRGISDKDMSWDENNGCSPHIAVLHVNSSDKIVNDLEGKMGASSHDFQLLGFTSKKCALSLILIVADRMGVDELQAVMSHELGHYVGIPHIYIPKYMQKQALMYPYADHAHSSSCLTILDLQKFCEINGCDAGRVRPCTN